MGGFCFLYAVTVKERAAEKAYTAGGHAKRDSVAFHSSLTVCEVSPQPAVTCAKRSAMSTATLCPATTEFIKETFGTL